MNTIFFILSLLELLIKLKTFEYFHTLPIRKGSPPVTHSRTVIDIQFFSDSIMDNIFLDSDYFDTILYLELYFDVFIRTIYTDSTNTTFEPIFWKGYLKHRE